MFTQLTPKRIFDLKKPSPVLAIVALLFCGLLKEESWYRVAFCSVSICFWMYAYIYLQKSNRPHDSSTRAFLKIFTEPNVDWAVMTTRGDLVVSGFGPRAISLPNTGSHKVGKFIFTEYVYLVGVVSGNGDLFASLMVDGDDEFKRTVACGRSGEQELLFTSLITGYGNRHWLIPGIFQGLPT